MPFFLISGKKYSALAMKPEEPTCKYIMGIKELYKIIKNVAKLPALQHPSSSIASTIGSRRKLFLDIYFKVCSGPLRAQAFGRDI